MVKIENAFKWVVVVFLLTTFSGFALHRYVMNKAEEADPVGFCIRDRLLDAADMKSRAHDALDDGQWDEGQRLLNQAWALERNMSPCLDFDETIDLPGPDAE